MKTATALIAVLLAPLLFAGDVVDLLAKVLHDKAPAPTK
jgi:hypothetical protein